MTLHERAEQVAKEYRRKMVDSDYALADMIESALREVFDAGKKAQLSESLAVMNKIMSAVCDECGKKIVKRKSDHRFCSSACQAINSKKRRAAAIRRLKGA